MTFNRGGQVIGGVEVGLQGRSWWKDGLGVFRIVLEQDALSGKAGNGNGSACGSRVPSNEKDERGIVKTRGAQ